MQNVRASQSFKRILAVVLVIGNYMNGGNVTMGQADGFHLDCLSSLSSIRYARKEEISVVAATFPLTLACSLLFCLAG